MLTNLFQGRERQNERDTVVFILGNFASKNILPVSNIYYNPIAKNKH